MLLGFTALPVLTGPPTWTEVDREWGGPLDGTGLMATRFVFAPGASRATRGRQ